MVFFFVEEWHFSNFYSFQFPFPGRQWRGNFSGLDQFRRWSNFSSQGGIRRSKSPRQLHDHAKQSHEQKGHLERGRHEARGVVADIGTFAAHEVGQVEGVQQPRLLDGVVRRLQPGGQRVLLRPASALLRLHPQLLSNGQASSGGGDVRPGFLRRPRLLGHRRALPGVLLPTQVPPEERARPRRDEEGGWVVEDWRGRRLWRPQVRRVPEVSLGSLGKADHVHRSQGELFLSFDRSIVRLF